MISFYIGRMKLCLDFSFFAVVGLFFALDSSGYGIFCISACLCHELAHLAVLLIKGRMPSQLIFSGGGICISQEKEERDVLVLISGCLANFLLFLIFYFVLPHNSIFSLLFALSNLCIGIFNLLPMGELDGKKLLQKFFIAVFPFRAAEAAIKAAEIICCVLSAAFAVFLFAAGTINLTAISFAAYIFLVDILLKKR